MCVKDDHDNEVGKICINIEHVYLIIINEKKVSFWNILNIAYINKKVYKMIFFHLNRESIYQTREIEREIWWWWIANKVCETTEKQ